MIGKLTINKEILNDMPLDDAIVKGKGNPAIVTPNSGTCKNKEYKKLVTLEKLLGKK